MTNLLFSSLELPERLAQGIAAMGFDTTTPVQAKAIPLIRTGIDVIAKSQTGTGKTVAFAIPMLELIDTAQPTGTVQVLILCPTRELAQQAGDEIRKLARFMPEIHPVEIYGGTSMERQFLGLRRANIVVGTPGRVMDHLRRKTLKLDRLKAVVLDEADEMLNMGFKEDIATILEHAPSERQTVLFSATMPPAILALVGQFQRDPQTVEIDRGQVTIQNIDQSCVDVPKGCKDDALTMLLEYHNPNRALIFCNTKRMVDDLTRLLSDRGFSVEGIHGDLNQSQRTKVMTSFKAGRVAILVATDVAARGIDVNDLDYVLNYDIPMTTEYYVHRIGRTGRAGKAGSAITLCYGRRQLQLMQEIAREVKSTIRQDNLPTIASLQEREQAHNLEMIEEALAQDTQPIHQSMVDELLKRGHSIEKIAAMALGLHFPVKQRKAFVAAAENTRRSLFDERKPIVKSTAANGYTDLVFDIGSSSRVAPNHLVGAITERANITGKQIGKIQVYVDKSVVAIPTALVDDVLSSMRGCKICGRPTNVMPMASTERSSSPHKAKPYAKPRSGAPRPSGKPHNRSFANRGRTHSD